MVDIDDDRGTLRLLQGWLELSAERRRGMSTHATEIFRKRFTAGAMAESLIEVIGETSKPGRAP
jgi:hypothetical protein